MTLAQKAVTDTVVRAPFDGLVEQRLVSVGDYVTRGTKVASVIRINPLRVELTVPGQYLSEVAAGRAVTLEVDAFRGKTFTGRIRYVSPVLRTDTRALVVEAVVPNESGQLKPGLFATAKIEQASETRAVLVPAAAITNVTGAARVYLIKGDHTAEERLVTTGQMVDELIQRLPVASRQATPWRRAICRSSPTAHSSPRESRFHHAVACRVVRSPAGVCVGADSVADCYRGVFLRAARHRSVSQRRHSHRPRDDPAAWRRARAGRERGDGQD